MNFNAHRVFVDEYGQPALKIEDDGVSTHYILTAVLVSEEDYKDANSKAEDVRRQYFQRGLIKSSKVSGDSVRRRKVLRALTVVPFKFYAFVIDKREIMPSSGLIYKRSFVKFVHNLLYTQLLNTLGSITISADRYGSANFMEEFKRYIQTQAKRDLFSDFHFEFSDDKQEVLIQIADFISGTLARCFDPKLVGTEWQDYLQILSENTLLIESWPPTRRWMTPSIRQEGGGHWDSTIGNLALDSASRFVLRHQDSQDPETIAQVHCAKYLLFQAQFVDSHRYVSSSEMRKSIQPYLDEDLGERALRAQVISKLRDADVLVVSGPKGYKLPLTESELREFVEDARIRIEPLAARLGRAWNMVRLATKGDLDLLAGERYEDLRQIVASASNTKC